MQIQRGAHSGGLRSVMRHGDLVAASLVIVAVVWDTLRGQSLPTMTIGAVSGLVGALVRRALIAKRFVRPVQLPPLPPLLIGRQSELTELLEVVRAPRARRGRRMAVVSGPAGVGKSALALTAAHRSAQSFPGGVLYARLSDYDHPRQAASSIADNFASALGGRDYRKLRGRRRLLILFDDVEDETWVGPLISKAPHHFFLITARKPFREDEGCYSLTLRELSAEASLDLLREVVGHSRVDDERDAAEEIVRYAQGYPLALTLAASPIANRPDYELAQLVKRLRAAEPVTTDKGKALGASVALLSNQERDALLALGLRKEETFAPWMLEAMLDIPGDVAMRISGRLAESKFVKQTSSDAAGISEYRLLQHVHTYAAERANKAFRRPKRNELLERLQVAKANRDANKSHELRVESFMNYVRGDLSTAVLTARSAIRLSRENKEKRGIALGLAALAEIHAELGDFLLARQIIKQIDKDAEVEAQIRSRRTLGKIHRRLRQADRASEYLQQALTPAIALDNPLEWVKTLREKAVTQVLVDPQAALATALEGIRLCAPIEPSGVWLAGLHWARAKALLALGKSEMAMDAVEEAARYADACQGSLWGAWIQLQKAIILLETGSNHAAREEAKDALQRFSGMRHRYGTAESRMIVGRAMFAEADMGSAVETFAEALETFHNCGDSWMEAEASLWLARALAQMETDGDSKESQQLLQAAEQSFQALGDSASVERVRELIADLPRASSTGRVFGRPRRTPVG